MKDLSPDFGTSSGTYALVMVLARARTIPVGRLGVVSFRAGYYIYVGSAFGPGGLAARVGRHLQRRKKNHWHIDTLRRFAEIREIWYTFHPEKVECRWSEILHAYKGTGVICPGFGSSDCHCSTHLFHFKRKPGIRTFRCKNGTQLAVKELKFDPVSGR